MEDRFDERIFGKIEIGGNDLCCDRYQRVEDNKKVEKNVLKKECCWSAPFYICYCTSTTLLITTCFFHRPLA